MSSSLPVLELVPRHHDQDPLPRVAFSLSRYGILRATSISEITLAVRSVPRGAIWCDLETCSPLHFCCCHVSSPDSPACRSVTGQSSPTSPSPRDPLPRVVFSPSRYGILRATFHGEIAPSVGSCHLSPSLMSAPHQRACNFV